jgi:hypothetical protein
MVDQLNGQLRKLPFLHKGLKTMLRLGLRTWRGMRRGA